MGTRRPPLQLWHEVDLDEEFTAARADGVATLDAYLDMEARVFDEMDAKVYARVPTGPAQQLNRYSADSASDPRRREPNWNRTFQLVPERPVGVVRLLHDVIARCKPAHSAGATRGESLTGVWPDDTIALSHVDLPFPPDDPLYGRYPPETPGQVFLGQLAIRGERGVLKVPAQWLLRLRHNPFYAYQERRVLDWVDQANGADGSATP